MTGFQESHIKTLRHYRIKTLYHSFPIPTPIAPNLRNRKDKTSWNQGNSNSNILFSKTSCTKERYNIFLPFS